jgi:glycosyltransferase involved in cell wall biosynthesis
LGRVDDVAALLRNADVFVLSSDHEGFPNVIIEAMAARLPVITTPVGDASVVVQHGTTGYIVPFDDVPAMAARVVELLQSPYSCQRMGNAGRRWVEDNCDYNMLAKRLLSIYKDIACQEGDSQLARQIAIPHE